MTNNQKAALESAIDKLKGYWEADELRALLADGGKGEAVADLLTDYIELNMSNYNEDDVSSLNEWSIRAYGVLTAPQAECAPREEDPDWMGKLPKCTEWPSGVAPRAEPVEESDVRPKERLCGGSHISCNGVDYCLGHPSCRDIAKERAEKDKK